MKQVLILLILITSTTAFSASYTYKCDKPEDPNNWITYFQVNTGFFRATTVAVEHDLSDFRESYSLNGDSFFELGTKVYDLDEYADTSVRCFTRTASYRTSGNSTRYCLDERMLDGEGIAIMTKRYYGWESENEWTEEVSSEAVFEMTITCTRVE